MTSDSTANPILALVLKILLILVLAEIVVMLLLPVIIPKGLNTLVYALIDALLMTALSCPFIWWFVLRPVHASAAVIAGRLEETAAARDRLAKEVQERKKAEEDVRRSELLFRVVAQDLRKTMEDLTRSNRELDQFASVASHDLQAPLRTVSSYLEYLAQDYQGQLDEQANDYITRAVNASKRMSELIRELLQFSRVGTRRQPFTSVDLGAVLRLAEENLEKEIKDNSARIVSERLPVVRGDELELERLVQNLIGNAIKYRTTERLPDIRVTAARRGNEWVFGVHDNGIGIGVQYLERIFVIFQRLHTAEEYPGTGMGLALCKKIVEQHGGRIWAESSPGLGSSINFTLPAEDESGR